jgi:hypothetical protein
MFKIGAAVAISSSFLGLELLMWKIRKWSLTSLQRRLVKTGGRLIKHARYYWLLLAKSDLPPRTRGCQMARWRLECTILAASEPVRVYSCGTGCQKWKS